MHLKEQGFKKVNGIHLYYEIYGAGRPVVLIHGGGSDGNFDFEETIKRFSDKFLLIVIDLQNHGKSEHRSTAETFEQDAGDITALLELLGVVKASFFGFSNGATTALLIASMFPDKVEKIIVASGLTRRSGMRAGFFEGMAQAGMEQMPQNLRDRFLKLNPDPEKLENMFEKDRQRMLEFKDIEEELIRAIKAPVCIIGGDNDVMKTSHFADLHQLISDARLMILPAGHGSYMMKDAQGFVDQELIDFTLSQVRRFLEV